MPQKHFLCDKFIDAQIVLSRKHLADVFITSENPFINTEDPAHDSSLSSVAYLMQTCYQTMMMTMNLEVTLKVFQVLLNYQTGYHGIQPWKL